MLYSFHLQRNQVVGASLLECEWQRDCHVHKNYSAVSGRGEPHPGVYARSCPMYSWGALLGVL